jgi:hypothetical protein
MNRCAALVALAVVVSCAADPDDSAAEPRAAAVQVLAHGCGLEPHVAGGAVLGPQQVVTVAHALEGATRVEVRTSDGRLHPAQIAAFDANADVAVLAADVDVAPLPHAVMPGGTEASMWVWRSDALVELPVTLARYVDIDITALDGTRSLRRGYELSASVEPGDSGGVVVSDGVATAVVYARSTQTANRAWATGVVHVTPLLDVPPADDIDTGDCV